MSSNARIDVPGVGDNGLPIIYNEATDRFSCVELPVAAHPELGYAVTAQAAVDRIASRLTAGAVRTVVPLYQYPSFFGSGWDTIETEPADFVIANPASGPGVASNPDWEREIASARAAGVIVVGYVNAAYATRPIADVRADIDTWYSLYDVDGIFFDLTPTANDLALVGWVQDACDHVRGKGRGQWTITNPGIYPLIVEYIDTCDITCVWEGEYTAQNYLGFDLAGDAPWALAYVPHRPAARFCHLVYGVTTAAQLQASLKHAIGMKAGNFYAYHGNSDWTALSDQWTAQRNLVRSGYPAEVRALGVVAPGAGPTGSRPSATAVGAGSMWYDTTLGKPIWSNGSSWRDAAGTVA